ncbi:MAG: PspC domain-containing protein [Bacteroidota bacterium]|nr:PspC domain-containing protein [Bacteroidota bacterium]
MKKAIQINLAGIVFHIDEDAYEILREYLTGVEHQFSGSADGLEVIQDLEIRMAELFTERLKPHRKVISTEDVRAVLKTMGAPEDIGEKRDEHRSYSGRGRFAGKRHSRMYRDSGDKPIGGVCSGLAFYFNTDPLLIRILFIIALFLGFGFLVYIVLWIALPLAHTQEQISEMKSGSYYF